MLYDPSLYFLLLNLLKINFKIMKNFRQLSLGNYIQLIIDTEQDEY